MKMLFPLLFVLLTTSLSASAQSRKKAAQNDTPSVVMLPEYARQVPDTAALQVAPRKKRRRFQTVFVPAPPPGRTRQEILYSDSLAKQPLRR